MFEYDHKKINHLAVVGNTSYRYYQTYDAVGHLFFISNIIYFNICFNYFTISSETNYWPTKDLFFQVLNRLAYRPVG